LTREHDQRARGSARLIAASRARSVGSNLGSWNLAAQHSQLVAQHQDLQVLGGVAADQQDEQLDGAAQRLVGEFRGTQVALRDIGGGVTLPRHD
jgi:hypothetical protein